MSRLPQIFFSYSVKKSVNPEIVRRVIHETKSAVRGKGWEIIDPMEESGLEGVREKVEAALRTSDACIIECTASVPNVMFEAGFCRSLGYPILFLVSPEARTDERQRPYFEFVGLDRQRTLPSDLGDIEFLTYPSDPRASAEWADFSQRLAKTIESLGRKLYPEARIVRENVKRFLYQTLRVLAHHPAEHPLLRFIGGWHSQLTAEFGQGGENVFEIDAVYYKRCIAEFRGAGAQNIRAVADLSDKTEEWWLDQSDPLSVSERLFLVDWKDFFDIERLAKLTKLLRDQSKDYAVQVGSVDQIQPVFHPFGDAAQGLHLLLMEPDLVGGYVNHGGRKYLRIDRSQERYREASELYHRIRRATIKVEPGWRESDIRSSWMQDQGIGLWNPDWGRIANRGPDYTDKYDEHIRAWIPDYDKLISYCVSLGQIEIARQLREGKGNIRVLEIGFGTGALTFPLLQWVENLNRPFRELQGQLLVAAYVGMDESDKMLEIFDLKIIELVRKARQQKEALAVFSPLLLWKGSAWDSPHPAVLNNAPYDLICSSLVLHDMIGKQPQQAVGRVVQQTSKYLSDGGCLIFADVFIESESREEQIAYWRKKMSQQGLSQASIKIFMDENPEMLNTVTLEQLGEVAKENGFLPPELKGVPATTSQWPFRVLVMKKGAQTS